jgi:deoxyxylulose-5-phosphate synthase
VEYFASVNRNVAVQLHGLPDRFVDHGLPDELYAEVGLNASGIASVVREFMSRTKLVPSPSR